MDKISLFKTLIIPALDRKYVLEKWIRNDSLVTIFKDNYVLDFATKKTLIGIFSTYIYKNIYICYNLYFYHVKNRKTNVTCRSARRPG